MVRSRVVVTPLSMGRMREAARNVRASFGSHIGCVLSCTYQQLAFPRMVLISSCAFFLFSIATAALSKSTRAAFHAFSGSQHQVGRTPIDRTVPCYVTRLVAASATSLSLAGASRAHPPYREAGLALYLQHLPDCSRRIKDI